MAAQYEPFSGQASLVSSFPPRASLLPSLPACTCCQVRVISPCHACLSARPPLLAVVLAEADCVRLPSSERRGWRLLATPLLPINGPFVALKWPLSQTGSFLRCGALLCVFPDGSPLSTPGLQGHHGRGEMSEPLRGAMPLVSAPSGL